MTDPEDHKTVWEACKHPLAEQEVIEKSCPTVFVSKLGLMVLVIFQIFIYIAFLPHWSICQEHKEVKVTFEKLHIYTSPRALFKRELKLLALLHLCYSLVSQFSQNGTFWKNL